MLTKIGAVLVLVLLLCGMPMHGSASTVLVNQADTWQYNVLMGSDGPLDLWGTGGSNWATVNYGTVPWVLLLWANGQGAFGNRTQSQGAPTNYNTWWAVNTDLALQKPFLVNGSLSNIVLNVASDNGFVIFINQVQVAKDNQDGGTSIWEYKYTLNPSYFINGWNFIQVLAEDHGGGTYFDMKLSADVTPVPDPPTVWLLGSGLLGLVGIRKKFRKYLSK